MMHLGTACRSKIPAALRVRMVLDLLAANLGLNLLKLRTGGFGVLCGVMIV